MKNLLRELQDVAYAWEQLEAIERLSERFPRERVEHLVESSIDRAEALMAAHRSGEISAEELVRRGRSIANEPRYGDALHQEVWAMLFSDLAAFSGNEDAEVS